MNYTAFALAVTTVFLPVFVALASYLIYETHQTQEQIMSFRTDADARLIAQNQAITDLATRIPATVDPATIVPTSDQSAVLQGIDDNTAKVAALAPPPAV